MDFPTRLQRFRTGRLHFLCRSLLTTICMGVICCLCFGAAPPPVDYPVTGFKLSYFHDHAGLPTVIEMKRWPIKLGLKGSEYVPAGSVGTPATIAPVTITLGQTFPTGTRFTADAIHSVDDQIVAHLKSLDIQSVFVAPEDLDDQTGQDQRQGSTALSLKIVVGAVSKVQTITEGPEVAPQDRTNDRRYDFIRENSPVQAEPGKELVDQQSMDDYLANLNRRGVRHVDAALSSADVASLDSMSLDYIIREGKPWTYYTGLSNTGTEETSPLRTRFGAIGNNLFATDDTFQADFSTTFTNKSNTVNIDYNSRFGASDRLRWAVHGDFTNFVSSDIGIDDTNLNGTNSGVSGELDYTLISHANSTHDSHFLDVFGGVRFEYLNIDDMGPNGGGFADVSGETADVAPYLGLRFLHQVPQCPTFAEFKATGIFNFAYSANADFDQLSTSAAGTVPQASPLGRYDLSRNAIVLNGQLTQSVFIDSLTESQRKNGGNGPLAYEVFGSLAGQYTLGEGRLNPVRESVIGGLYSVRGYRQSIVAGDDSIVGTAEFRLHIPRLLGKMANEKPLAFGNKLFYRYPQQGGGLPDWDLIIRPFIDAGIVSNNGSDTAISQAHENRSQTLIGAGVGAELDIWQNLSFRVDYGIALKTVTSTQAVYNLGVNRLEGSAGSSVVNFSLLLTF